MTELQIAMMTVLGINPKALQHTGAALSCTDNGCTHTKVCGVDALLTWERVRRGELPACSRRKYYLQQQVSSLLSFMEGKVECPVAWAQDKVSAHFTPEGEVGAVTVDEIVEEQGGSRFNQQGQDLVDEQREWQRLSRKAEKAGRSIEDRAEYARNRLEACEKELELCARIQDFLDTFDSTTHKGLLIATKRRLDALKTSKVLSWDSFVIMANQLHALLGWKQIQSKYQSREITDVVSYWEEKLDTLHALAVQEEGKVFETSLNTLDNYEV